MQIQINSRKKLNEDFHCIFNFMNKVFCLLFLASLLSCSPTKDVEELVVLKPLPENVTFAINEKSQLEIYEDRINSMDIKGVERRLNSKIEKENFTRQMVKLRKSYNECVDKITEIEKMKDQNKLKNEESFKNCINRLDVIVKYVFSHYKL